MGRASRDKGARGEREWAAFLRAAGASARRGRQFSGSPESPDVVSSLPFHFEVKRTERLSLYEAMAQAASEAPEGVPPVVAHRKNRRGWLVVMRAEDWLRLVTDTDARGVRASSEPRPGEARKGSLSDTPAGADPRGEA